MTHDTDHAAPPTEPCPAPVSVRAAANCDFVLNLLAPLIPANSDVGRFLRIAGEL